LSINDEETWINYMSHELVGLTAAELEEYFYKQDDELRDVFSGIGWPV
jgi:hypothetical protein